MDGHYLILYLKFIIRILNKEKFNIFLITSNKAKNHSSIDSLMKECPHLNIVYLNTPQLKLHSNLSLICYQIKLYFLIKKQFRKLSKNLFFDYIFINSIDHFEKALAIFGDPFQKVPFSGIYVNPKFHMKEVGFIKVGRFNFLSKILFFKLLTIKNLDIIFTNDIYFVDYIKNKYSKLLKKITFLFEPREFVRAPFYNQAKKKLNLPLKCFNVLVYGSLKKTKGIHNLLNIFNDKKIAKKVVVTLAGKQDNFVKKLLSLNKYKKLILQKKIYIYDNFLNDYDESLIFNSADIVWVGYERNFPYVSGVLFQAAIKKKPILASKYGIIGAMCRKYKLGYSLDCENVKEVIKYLNSIMKIRNYKKFVKNTNVLSKLSKPKFFIYQIYDNILKNI